MSIHTSGATERQYHTSGPTITLESRGRRGGGFLCSSLPNHDAKGWKEKTETENKEKESRANCVREG